MEKNLGFTRTLLLPWLDAVAAFSAETDDPGEMRARLEPVLAHDVTGAESRRKAMGVLIQIWVKSGEIAPDLHAEAVVYFQATPIASDRLWLHYGLALVRFPFFRACVAAIGQFGRYGQGVTTRMVKQRLVAELGQLGDIKRSTERVMASLRSWGILTDSEQRNAYVLQRAALAASSVDLEVWLLACALHAHPAAELTFADLLHLPELVPFRFTVTVDDLRSRPRFAVQRQGGGWDMVRLVSGVTR